MLFTHYENLTASDSSHGNNLGNFQPMITASIAANNTWTALTTLISSTPFDSYGVSFTVTPLWNTGSGYFHRGAYEVYQGASGSETKLIDTFTAKNGADDYEYGFPNNHIYFPIFVPANTRLTFRAKLDVFAAGAYVKMYAHFYRNAPMRTNWLGNTVTTYGYNDTNLQGQEITPNATANSWGSWTQITASTTKTHKAFIAENFPPTNKTASTERGYSYQLGIGASGSESVISPTYRSGCGPFTFYSPRLVPVYRDIPAGSRISCRVKSSAASASAFSVIFQGIS